MWREKSSAKVYWIDGAMQCQFLLGFLWLKNYSYKVSFVNVGGGGGGGGGGSGVDGDGEVSGSRGHCGVICVIQSGVGS